MYVLKNTWGNENNVLHIYNNFFNLYNIYIYIDIKIYFFFYLYKQNALNIYFKKKEQSI